uniref:Uncharacterized protein n=1 Tax=Parascaris equorum TaxID=6256 RepID=A0A914S523_PAREQ
MQLEVEYNRYLFLPTVDGKQLPANPYWMLTVIPAGTMNYASPVPYLTGLNREDGVEVAIAEAIIDRYKYWPDPSDEDAIRAKFVEVRVLLGRFSFDCSLDYQC